MTTLAIVPARGGSKGIPHKNTRKYQGIPLIGHAIRVGLDTCDRTMVTTDDLNIACLASIYGVKVIMRPPELARDDTPMLPVLQHVLENLDGLPDAVVLLQPSSPSRRRAEYVTEALRKLDEEHADSVVSVVPVPAHFAPGYVLQIAYERLTPYSCDESDGPQPLDTMPTRRQDCAPAYYRDGTVYVTRAEYIADSLYGDTCVPLMVNPHDSVTLDTEEDWTLAEAKHG